MNSRDTARRIATIALVVGATLWVTWFIGLVDKDFQSDTDGNVLGVDHSVFHTAGRLIVDGEPRLLYTTDEFNAALAEVRERPVSKRTPTYLHPPALAYVFAPTSGMPRIPSWLAFAFLSVALMAISFRWLGVPVLGAVALAMLSLPGWLNFRLGQLASVWMLIFAGVFALIRSDRYAAAGFVAGFLALKPQFGIALALWWAFDFVRYRVALFWAAGTALAISAVTFAITPESLSGIIGAAQGAVSDPKFPIGFSLNDTILGMFPNLPELPVAGAVAAVGAIALLTVVRRHRTDTALQFAAAGLAAVWMSPHFIAYDWVLIATGLAALWAARPSQRSAWLAIAGVMSLVAAAAWMLAQIGRATVGIRLELAAVGLAVVAWIAYRRYGDTDISDPRTITSHV